MKKSAAFKTLEDRAGKKALDIAPWHALGKELYLGVVVVEKKSMQNYVQAYSLTTSSIGMFDRNLPQRYAHDDKRQMRYNYFLLTQTHSDHDRASGGHG